MLTNTVQSLALSQAITLLGEQAQAVQVARQTQQDGLSARLTVGSPFDSFNPSMPSAMVNFETRYFHGRTTVVSDSSTERVLEGYHLGTRFVLEIDKVTGFVYAEFTCQFTGEYLGSASFHQDSDWLSDDYYQNIAIKYVGR